MLHHVAAVAAEAYSYAALTGVAGLVAIAPSAIVPHFTKPEYAKRKDETRAKQKTTRLYLFHPTYTDSASARSISLFPISGSSRHRNRFGR